MGCCRLWRAAVCRRRTRRCWMLKKSVLYAIAMVSPPHQQAADENWVCSGRHDFPGVHLPASPDVEYDRLRRAGVTWQDPPHHAREGMDVCTRPWQIRQASFCSFARHAPPTSQGTRRGKYRIRRKTRTPSNEGLEDTEICYETLIYTLDV